MQKKSNKLIDEKNFLHFCDTELRREEENRSRLNAKSIFQFRKAKINRARKIQSDFWTFLDGSVKVVRNNFYFLTII